MPNYLRMHEKGGLYFLTLVTYQRQKLFSSPKTRLLFRVSVDHVMVFHPFTIEAYCILPDHIHFIWRLPEDDADYAMRIGLIKARFTKSYLLQGNREMQRDLSREKRRERTFWQRRFWEHLIRDEDDLHRHIEYIHYNPVKHGLVERVSDWPDSSFPDFVKAGILEQDWGGSYQLQDSKSKFGE
jgi:putative transposase